MANPAMANVKIKTKYVMFNNGSLEEINEKFIVKANSNFEAKTHDQELFNFHENIAKVQMLNDAINKTHGTSSRLLNKLRDNKVEELKEKLKFKKADEPRGTNNERPVDEVVAFINGEDGTRDIKGTKRNKKKRKKNKKKEDNEASTSEDRMTPEDDFDPAMIQAIDREVEQFEKVLSLSRSERIQMLYLEGASGK